jgi:hypothetical protein
LKVIAESLYDVYSLVGVNGSSTLNKICIAKNKFGMFLMIKDLEAPLENLVGIAPFLALPENSAVLQNRIGFILFDNRDDLEYTFNPLKEFGEVIYALTCDPSGRQIDETI